LGERNKGEIETEVYHEFFGKNVTAFRASEDWIDRDVLSLAPASDRIIQRGEKLVKNEPELSVEE
jgi:hypothetical protein